VEKNKANSHKRNGWEIFTVECITVKFTMNFYLGCYYSISPSLFLESWFSTLG
jgi:hypothetical protein